MKVLIALGITVIVFTSCGTLISPEIQYEREQMIAAYDAAREKHNPERVKEAVKDLLVGKWQYVGLEVEEGNVSAQQVKPMSQQTINSPTSSTAVASKDATSERTTASNAPGQPIPPNPPNIEADTQTPEPNAPRCHPLR